jgi:serine/threonine-protein kinase SRPK3
MGRLFNSLARKRPTVSLLKMAYLSILLIYQSRLDLWVSIKIMRSDKTDYCRDLHTLLSIGESNASKYVVQLFDSFDHRGPNGTHKCLVFELLGPTVDFVLIDYCDSHDKLDPMTILNMTKQFLQGVAALHAAGYAHGG